jgi:predicted RNA-binding Zn ribbon-like protein
MPHLYEGPLRNGPIAVELYNTLYADRGRIIDGLRSERSRAAWLKRLSGLVPAAGPDSPAREDMVELRGAVRRGFDALVGGRLPPRDAVETINRFSVRAPRAPIATWHPSGPPRRGEYVPANRSDRALAALAADAIDTLTGPTRDLLRACGAPGCVLMFVEHRPRRHWCSNACGNRARQARHYRRLAEQRRGGGRSTD